MSVFRNMYLLNILEYVYFFTVEININKIIFFFVDYCKMGPFFLIDKKGRQTKL